MDKPDFVGKAALERLAGLPPRLRLAGLRFEGEAPPEGARSCSPARTPAT